MRMRFCEVCSCQVVCESQMEESCCCQAGGVALWSALVSQENPHIILRECGWQQLVCSALRVCMSDS